ncbi:TPA: hypothetical protein ACKP1C_002984 [Serratia marcescens]|uniref:MrpH family fimbial adhesin n=1 Tax=Serratia TaxID=613 RepID=UPI0013DC1651|nr:MULTISPECIES: hypothetical protein [Serratia]MBH2616853.1 hypothetical protein [Serratia ureilytica]MBJ2104375.1 hypothetical protein [Serratia ureilytica]
MKKILFLWLLLHVPQAAASWVIDAQYSPSQKRFIVKVIRWDEYDPARNPLKNCRFTSTCKLAFTYSDRSHYIDPFGYMDMPEASDLNTMGELAQLFARKGYLNREVKSQFGLYEEPCLGLAYPVYSAGSIPYVPLPGGEFECFAPQIDPTYCSIADAYIELNHGTINTNSVNGRVAAKQFRVACNNAFSLAIIAVDKNGSVSLGGGIISHLKINGVDIGSGYLDRIGPEGKTLTLTSTLSGYRGGTGDFQGYKVIMLTLP